MPYTHLNSLSAASLVPRLSTLFTSDPSCKSINSLVHLPKRYLRQILITQQHPVAPQGLLDVHRTPQPVFRPLVIHHHFSLSCLPHFSLSIYSVYLLAVLGLHCFVRAFSSYRKWGLLFTAARGLGNCASHGPEAAGSAVMAQGPGCSTACGIFLNQGSRPCALFWRADSYPLYHQGCPLQFFYF